MNSKAGFLEALKSTPKTPTILGLYSSGVTSFMLTSQLIYTPLMNSEDPPCHSCYLFKSIAISIVSGVLLPVVALPHLVFHSVSFLLLTFFKI